MMNNKLARLFRTELRRQAKAGPNFTGAFTITNWSCGAGCLDFAIVDVRSGQVFDPGVGGISAVFNAGLVTLDARPDSRLLVLVGAPHEDVARDGVHYLVWQGRRLKEIRFVPRSQVCSTLSSG